jgi:hypothetical protein
VTIKLSHWKDVNLRSADQVHKEIEQFGSTGDINIDKLLSELQTKHDELEELTNEHDVFENELDFSVHEPMREKDAKKKSIRKLVVEKIALRREVAEAERREEQPTVKDVMGMNESLRAVNAQLREEIARLEHKKKLRGQDQVIYVNGLFPAQSQTPRLRLSAKITKPVARGSKPKSARPLYLNV